VSGKGGSVDGTTWTDPRYAALVDAWDRLKKHPRQETSCRGCFGVGAVVMVTGEDRKPLILSCLGKHPADDKG
jgi:hypothetical protein